MAAAAVDFQMVTHPACEWFPMMNTEALGRLTEDIRANGLLNPIVTHESMIVDGRNRQAACLAAGVAPRFIEWRDAYCGEMSLARWVWSVNAERRHLTPDQIATAHVAIAAHEAREEARRRQLELGREGGKDGGRGIKKTLIQIPGEGLPDADQRDRGDRGRFVGDSGRTDERLAKEAGVSRYKIEQALSIQKADPELLKDVVRGSVTLNEATKQVAKRESKTQPTKPVKPRSHKQHLNDNAAKQKMIAMLSHIRGSCRGLSLVKVNWVVESADAEEIQTWIELSRELARDIRGFAQRLESAAKERHASKA